MSKETKKDAGCRSLDGLVGKNETQTQKLAREIADAHPDFVIINLTHKWCNPNSLLDRNVRSILTRPIF